jgi:hypothetical protein
LLPGPIGWGVQEANRDSAETTRTWREIMLFEFSRKGRGPPAR